MSNKMMTARDERGVKRSASTDERGVVTAEYAVAMLGGVSIAGVLIKIFTDPRFQELLFKIIEFILNLIFKMVA